MGFCCGPPASAAAQAPRERIDTSAVARIKREATEHSQLQQLAHHLTDVIGPRLTGSSGMRAASAWTAETFRQWGLSNVTVEPWGEFGRGWENLSYSGNILTPYRQPMPGQPRAWTAGTNGTVTAPVVAVPGGPDSLTSYGDRVKGAFVMLNRAVTVDPLARHSRESRIPNDSLLTATGLDYQFGGSVQPSRRAPATPPAARTGTDTVLPGAIKKLLAAGVAGLIVPSSQPNGLIDASFPPPGKDAPFPTSVPTIIIGREQYNQIYRNITGGTPVQVQLNVQNRFLTDDTKGYNTLADIPGGDKADEVVMIGAHLDSWHVGNGASDDGAGVLVMMEAMRILKALDLHPRRTIRVGLWSGEEQGILGSAGWVHNHRELWPKISAYFNMDYGTGRIRGIWHQSNEGSIAILDQIVGPLNDLGVQGVHRGDITGSDHVSFQDVGIPAFPFFQDPIQLWIPSGGSATTLHTSIDVYDHLLIDDLKQAAAVVASIAYSVANREAPMPRK